MDAYPTHILTGDTIAGPNTHQYIHPDLQYHDWQHTQDIPPDTPKTRRITPSSTPTVPDGWMLVENTMTQKMELLKKPESSPKRQRKRRKSHKSPKNMSSKSESNIIQESEQLKEDTAVEDNSLANWTVDQMRVLIAAYNENTTKGGSTPVKSAVLWENITETMIKNVRSGPL